MQVFFIDDINGDGIPEFGCGAFCTDYNNDNSGSVYIFDGATQTEIRRHDGRGIQARLGETAIACGDLDGDGFVDYAGGARNERVKKKNKGMVYVWSGLTGDLLYYLKGQKLDSNFGRGLASIGDLDGDGAPEIVVGSPAENNNRGAVRIFSGATGHRITTLNGLPGNGRFGYRVTDAGDVNLDGYPDVAISAPWENSQSGAVYIHSGKDGHGLQQIIGMVDDARLGYSLTGVGDSNGDGRVELLVGAPCSDTAYLITAKTAEVLRTYQGQLTPTKSGVGHNFAAAGDVDGDGYPDYAIGHPGEWDFGLFLYNGPGGGTKIISGKTGKLITFHDPYDQDDGFGSSIAIYVNHAASQCFFLIGSPAWGDLVNGHAPGMVSGRMMP